MDDSQRSAPPTKRRKLTHSNGMRRSATRQDLGSPAFLRTSARNGGPKDGGARRAESARERILREFSEQPEVMRTHGMANSMTWEMDRLEKEVGATAAEATSADVLGTETNEADILEASGVVVRAKQVAVPPWIVACTDIDEASAALDGDAEKPPYHLVNMRVQNWVTRMEKVVAYRCPIRAVERARADLLRERALDRWWETNGADSTDVPPSMDRDTRYDWLYATRASRRVGRVATAALYEPTGDRPVSRGRRPWAPLWDKKVPRVADAMAAVDKAMALARGLAHDEDPDNPFKAHRPVFHMNSLVRATMGLGTRYDPNNFAAMKRSVVNPKAASLVYASARVVCTGGKTPEEAAWATHRLMADMRLAGSQALQVDRSRFKVSNVVASAILPFFEDLEKLVRQCSTMRHVSCKFTKEIFPGATLRMRKDLGKIAILVYTTKLIIAGARNPEGLRRAMRKALDVTWKARFVDMNSENANGVLTARMRALYQLLHDATGP